MVELEGAYRDNLSIFNFNCFFYIFPPFSQINLFTVNKSPHNEREKMSSKKFIMGVNNPHFNACCESANFCVTKL